MVKCFNGCSNVTQLNVSGFNTSNVTDIGNMFFNCSSLTQLDVSNFNTSNVTNMHGVFYGCSGLTNLDVSNFDTSNVRRMAAMFEGCSGLTSLDLRSFDTSNIDYISSMFEDCTNLTTIYATSNFDISGVNDSVAFSIFRNCINLVGGNGTTYDSSHIDKTYARIDQTEVPGYFTSLDIFVKLYEDGTLMFSNTNYTDTSKTLKKDYGAIPSNNNWTFSPWYSDDNNEFITKVQIKDKIQPISTHNWFLDCKNLTTINGIANLDTSNTINMGYMFSDCQSLTSLDLSNFDTSNVTMMAGMFYGCSNLTSLDLSNFDTSKVENMYNMFCICGVTSLDLSNFDTSNVTMMASMFYGCGKLTSLDLSNFDTSNVTDMNRMFLYCSALTTLDVSSFDTSNVTNCDFMFANCDNLVTIYASDKFALDENYFSNNGMFRNCNKLKGGNGTTYRSSCVSGEYARIDRTGTPGYFTQAFESYATSLNGVTLNNWKIFYNDGNYIYLILDDYLPNSAVSNTMRTNYNLTNGNGDYSIKSTTNRKDLIDAMTTKSNWNSLLIGTLNGKSIDYRSSTDTNVKAMGSPTLDLYVNSWNVKYSSDKIYTAIKTGMTDSIGWGYYVGNEENPTKYGVTKSNSDPLYSPPSSYEGCQGYWLASPSAGNPSGVIYVELGSNVNWMLYDYPLYAFRPVICLPISAL